MADPLSGGGAFSSLSARCFFLVTGWLRDVLLARDAPHDSLNCVHAFQSVNTHQVGTRLGKPFLDSRQSELYT